MPVIYPAGTPTLGNTKVLVTPDVANLAAPSLASEIGDAAAVDLSCFLYPAGWNPTATPAKGTKPARLCSKRTQEQFNRTSYGAPDLQYVYDPQGDDSDPGNEAKEALVEGTTQVFIERIGLDAEDVNFVVGQKVRLHHLLLGEQIPSGDRTDENGEFYIVQPVVYVNDGPVDGVIVA